MRRPTIGASRPRASPRIAPARNGSARYAVAAERAELEAYKLLAREAGDKIADDGDRAHFDEDFAML